MTDILFSSVKEGQRFKNPKTGSKFTKKTDIVSNAVSDSGVRMMFSKNEKVILLEE